MSFGLRSGLEPKAGFATVDGFTTDATGLLTGGFTACSYDFTLGSTSSAGGVAGSPCII